LFGYRNTIRNCKFENWTRPIGSSLHCDLFQAFTNNNEESMDHIIENNFMINCTPGCQLGIVSDIKLSGKAGGWTFRNNVIVNQAAPFYIQTPNHKFYNNTMVRSPTEQSQQFLLYYTADRGIANNTTFYNNIFYKGGSNPASTSGGFYDKAVGGALSSSFRNQILNLVSDYNLFYGENGTAKVSTTLTENNGNINSVNPGNPLFVNEFGTNKEDYRILAGSATIGRGIALNNLFTADSAGTTRGATWDIGAFQYAAGALLTDNISPTIQSASIDSQGSTLTLVFSENVKDVNPSHYNLSTGSLSVSTGSGNSRTFTITPAVQTGVTVTLNYTPGNTSDISSNLLASVTDIAVINNSFIVGDIYKNRKGRTSLARP